MNFLDCVEINPRVSMQKGKVYPFVDMASVSTSSREPDTVDEKEYTSGVKFSDGDTVIARIEPCLQNGKRFWAHEIGMGFGSTEFLVFRAIKGIMDEKYLYYFMMTENIKKKMVNSMTGATGRQRVNNDVFKSMEIDLPDLPTQHRIASILSAYDDLIENNRRQIKLLEEAARRLYREWFVELRFPGHEGVKVVDGVPEGWKKTKIGNVFSTTSGGTPSRKNPGFYQNGTIPWIKTKELSDGYIFETEECITQEAVASSSAKMIVEGSILVAMYGATIGKLGIATSESTCNQACCVFEMKGQREYRWFLYQWLLDNRTFMISQGKGAAQSNLSQEVIKSFDIVLPDEKIINRYHSFVDAMFDKRAKLEQQIQLLVKARNMLLPKLMSGEMEG